ncbi:ubiquinone/menaquinone biosynthesis C-methylase UbiE [Algoriphagus sp. 4150]|uniref:class I SAM-dependent methyltransferase n=1 Tax=Algoriphagus sp. 4150 TaxID=2817756 RepID=UPI002863FBF5|nr:class I SAM-dependent methyltransferase [Algoriphagus sp. 4150]MDR7128193.1 ubiquinone/menaquinone biosynthesis C-methylase UbiE [Algoriphagus sp. 4150]
MNSDEKSPWEFPFYIPTNPVKKFLKNSIGKAAILISPKIKNELLGGKMPKNKFERAALTSIFIELNDKKLLDELAELHKKIWTSNDNQGYYDFTSNRLRGMFEQLKEPLYTTISNQTKENAYDEFIELGCGEGIIVNRMSEKYPEINSFLGVDINKAQIEINKTTYAGNTKLRFQSGDLSKDLASIKGPNKIYLTFGGVLEYLTEQELLFLLKELSVLKNTVFILYEPIEPGFNIKEEKHSILYGSEFSFCHPYHYYLSKAGFDIIGEKLVNSDKTSWIYLAAKIN